MSPTEPSLPAVPEPGDFAEAGEPFVLFSSWLKDAEKHEPNDPNAMALATVDKGGYPNVRMVLLKALDPAGHRNRGFVFYTNYESAKGEELLASPARRARLLLEELAPAGAHSRRHLAGLARRSGRLLREPAARRPDRRMGLQAIASAREPYGAREGGGARSGAVPRRQRPASRRIGRGSA